jgi:hypothetical protein
MADNSNNKYKELIQKIENIMKCEICKEKYDYNDHRPMIVKCGHTFCKFCIFNSTEKNKNNDSNKNKFFKCPIDSVKHIFNLEKGPSIKEANIYPNLKLEIILKEILNINEPAIKEKHIVYSKPDMKRSKSPENKNTLNNNSEGNFNNNIRNNSNDINMNNPEENNKKK